MLTTPLFRELKRIYPNSRCTVVVQPGYRAILTTNRNVDEILPLHRAEREMAACAREAAGVGAVVLLDAAPASAIRHGDFTAMGRGRESGHDALRTDECGLRVGHSEHASAAKRRINRGFDAAFDVLVPPGPVRHEVDRNLADRRSAGRRGRQDRRLEIRLTANDRKFASELLTPSRPSTGRWLRSALGHAPPAAGGRCSVMRSGSHS